MDLKADLWIVIFILVFLLVGARSRRRREPFPWIHILFFCSGFPALIYQIVWQRARRHLDRRPQRDVREVFVLVVVERAQWCCEQRECRQRRNEPHLLPPLPSETDADRRLRRCKSNLTLAARGATVVKLH